ncbi:acyl-CoA-binding domain-containing protein 4 [Hyla sarda]|uniref:acyl-CoA-binding domain-containing protein 4 n=1 Tax=Hyla sarda TaxID=327740 RepID=UPI0024C3B8C3|nr:acyl-CoA-binding domain-containing protein 4 [Hyla sarda]XP_056405364.1 acyl-CoA-binding domain-containing protein 4 [Hyla sarda]XP_056405365.1 acyl-CoA-binding domain-containing protein 4 [Hyla sarda]XP_056405366.1 acyl-CoA-binding domain-containing protein 4 [Hyla sarda]XP_056405367.1 acyl-CoA-binding domain-containing protein 4 [Hyla sarda]XP_056405368.1 acyl-CoA-binding domain-containing protein 4 [Hyla sarda]
MGTDQDETGYRRQFNAAVSVIQSLPKNGAYRPSYEEMLRFYSYYKQATVGPCNISRPGFWDPIGKYKWDAWSKLGAMSQEDAMCAYIREMKMVAQKIIDTFPLEDTSPEMIEPFRPLYDVIPDMPRPPDSFFTTTSETEHSEDITEHAIPERSEEMEDQQSRDHNQYATGMEEVELGTLSAEKELEQRADPLGGAAHPVQADQRLHSWGSENDYSDSVEQLMSDQEYEHGSHLFKASDVTHKKTKTKSRRKSADRRKDDVYVPESHSTNDGWLRNLSEEDHGDTSSGLQTRCQNNPNHLSPQIKATVEALQASVQGLCQRLESLERTLQDQRQYIESQAQRSHKVPKQQLPSLAKSQTFLFIVIWPFVVHWLLRRFLWRKR